MKKLLIAFGLIGLATASFGQGEINFANSTTSRLTTNSVVGGPSTGSTAGSDIAPHGYYVAMFIANQSVTQVGGSAAARFGYLQDYAFDDPNWTMLPTIGTNRITGRFSGADSPQGGLLTGPSYTSQSSASFVAIAWSANIGSTVDELKNWYHGFGVGASGPGWIGESQVGVKMLIGGGLASPSTIFNTNPGFIPGWMLGLIIPEPAFLTVTGLGVAVILVSSRRRKRRRRHRKGLAH